MGEVIKVINEQVVLEKEFKVYGDLENPIFLAKDVANWIENKNVSQMLKNIDEDEKGLYNVYTLGGIQNTWFLTEDGLYEALMLSRKPIAKQFKKEVKKILKQIRKTGGYIPVNESDTDLEILAKGMLVAQKTIENKNAEIKQLTEELADTQTKLGGCKVSHQEVCYLGQLLSAMASRYKYPDDYKEHCRDALFKNYGVFKLSDLPHIEYSNIMKFITSYEYEGKRQYKKLF